MPNAWDFEPTAIEYTTYATGERVPRLHIWVLLNGERVGYAELHLHKNRRGPSFGFTGVVDKDRIGPAWELEG